ncbi:hypothetical protein EVAR_77113_1 [Eumeta japonica]|uniref:Uncharacterized protein n=1 Tax=Eumeta variegata TaxID=151549 RepID=A0A4C1T4N0_EUMVA|nr:hypothetical protein EVAR_77113_1 [Eumeta japonica]
MQLKFSIRNVRSELHMKAFKSPPQKRRRPAALTNRFVIRFHSAANDGSLIRHLAGVSPLRSEKIPASCNSQGLTLNDRSFSKRHRPVRYLVEPEAAFIVISIGFIYPTAEVYPPAISLFQIDGLGLGLLALARTLTAVTNATTASDAEELNYSSKHKWCGLISLKFTANKLSKKVFLPWVTDFIHTHASTHAGTHRRRDIRTYTYTLVSRKLL